MSYNARLHAAAAAYRNDSDTPVAPKARKPKTSLASRARTAARVANAETDLSDAAREALLSTSPVMSAAVFNELTKAGYIVSAKRGWGWSADAEAYIAAKRRT